MSAGALGKELGLTRTTIKKWMDAHGIIQQSNANQLADIRRSLQTDEQKNAAKQKREQTNLAKFGVTNPFADKSIKEQIASTMKEKYGAEKPLQSNVIREKQKQTMIDRYGAPYAMEVPELRAKQQEYFTEQYGCNPGSLPENIEKARQTNLTKYGRIHANQRHISLDVLENMNSRDWLYHQHYTLKKPLNEIAKECGVDITQIMSRFYGHGLELQTQAGSYAQYCIATILRERGLLVQENIRGILAGNLELDIVLPDKKIAIEYCGIYWHCDKFDRITSKYHLHKLEQCEQLGYRLITVFEDEWVHKKDLVINKILHIVGCSTESAIYARKCKIVSLTTKEKSDFFNQYHIQGDGPSSINYGLLHGEKIVACMGFIMQSDEAILNRYATSCNVPGGFQRLLKFFIQNNKIDNIISFADRRWSSTINIYVNSGFKFEHYVPPDYRYVIGDKTYHKFGFRLDQLRRFLGEKFNPDLSEVQNMRSNGFYRIWNCGLIKYSMKVNK